MKNSIIIYLSFLLLGALLAISIKYPLSIEEIKRVEKICSPNQIKKIKVGISGTVYEVQCSDDKIFNVRKKNGGLSPPFLTVLRL